MNCKDCLRYYICKNANDNVNSCFFYQESCSYCRNEEPIREEVDFDNDCDLIQEFIKDTDFKYCPYCGRELESEE